MAEEQVKKKKSIKKKFFEVEVPLISSKAKLYGYSIGDFENKVIKLDLTKNLRGKNLELRSKIKVIKNELGSELISLQLIQSYIRKMMRRGTDYIEDSFEAGSKDSMLRIKPFMITRKRVSRAVKNEIRKAARKNLEAYITIRTTKEIFSEIMTNKLQKMLSQKVKKTYPLALCEIRMVEVIGPAEKPAKAKATEAKRREEVSAE